MQSANEQCLQNHDQWRANSATIISLRSTMSAMSFHEQPWSHTGSPYAVSPDPSVRSIKFFPCVWNSFPYAHGTAGMERVPIYSPLLMERFHMHGSHSISVSILHVRTVHAVNDTQNCLAEKL